MATRANTYTAFATINLKASVGTIYTLSEAQDRRAVVLGVAFSLDIQTDSAETQGGISIGSNASDYDNVLTEFTVNQEVGTVLHAPLSDLNDSVWPNIVTSGLRAKLVTQSGFATASGLLVVTYALV